MVYLDCDKPGEPKLKKQFFKYFMAKPAVATPGKLVRFVGQAPGADDGDGDGELEQGGTEPQASQSVPTEDSAPEAAPPQSPERTAAVRRLGDIQAAVTKGELMANLPGDPDSAKALLTEAARKIQRGDIDGANRAAAELEKLVALARRAQKIKTIDTAMERQATALDSLSGRGADEKQRVDNLRACYSDARARGDADFAQKILASVATAINSPAPVAAGRPLSDEDCEKIVRDEKGWPNVKKKYIPMAARMTEIIAIARNT